MAREHGNNPFAALIVAPNGVVLLEAENTVITEKDCTGHAELNLVRRASQRFAPEILAASTLYTSTEPCAMCSGAIYWSGVGRVVFSLSETQLYAMGRDPNNPALVLPCREVFARGRRHVEVVGPMLEDEAREVHEGFWSPPG